MDDWRAHGPERTFAAALVSGVWVRGLWNLVVSASGKGKCILVVSVGGGGSHGGRVSGCGMVRAGAGGVLLGLHRLTGQYTGPGVYSVYSGVGIAGPGACALDSSVGSGVGGTHPDWRDSGHGGFGGDGFRDFIGDDEAHWGPQMLAVVPDRWINKNLLCRLTQEMDIRYGRQQDEKRLQPVPDWTAGPGPWHWPASA